MLLLLATVPFVCDMAFMFDVVHLVLLAIMVLQDRWTYIVVFHASPEVFKCQATRQGVFL